MIFVEFYRGLKFFNIIMEGFNNKKIEEFVKNVCINRVEGCLRHIDLFLGIKKEP